MRRVCEDCRESHICKLTGSGMRDSCPYYIKNKGPEFTEEDLNDFVGSAPGLTGDQTSAEYIDSMRKGIMGQPTSEPPTEPGWYWYKPKNLNWVVNELTFETGKKGLMVNYNPGRLPNYLEDFSDGLWQGPITPPEGG